MKHFLCLRLGRRCSQCLCMNESLYRAVLALRLVRIKGLRASRCLRVSHFLRENHRSRVCLHDCHSLLLRQILRFRQRLLINVCDCVILCVRAIACVRLCHCLRLGQGSGHPDDSKY